MYFLCDSNVTRKSAYIVYTSSAADENEIDLCDCAEKATPKPPGPKINWQRYICNIYILSQQPRSLTRYRVPVLLVGEPRVRMVQVAEAPTMMEGNHTNHDTPLTSSVAVSPM